MCYILLILIIKAFNKGITTKQREQKKNSIERLNSHLIEFKYQRSEVSGISNLHHFPN